MVVDNLMASGRIASTGMYAQGKRLRVIAENMANADSVSKIAGGRPYQRKLVLFKDMVDRKTGLHVVNASRTVRDPTEFRLKFEPNHPAADNRGYVAYPNVNMLVEMSDMREAQRSYEANLNVITTAKDMMAKTIDILK